MKLTGLIRANLTRKPGRTAALACLVALLAFTLFGGTLVLSSLSSGMQSLEARLGADVLVAPRTARSTTDLTEVLVDGVPGNFYMDDSVVAQVEAIEGVEKVSPQYYLATVKAGCCSFPVQIIGIDPATDFTIQPWIARSYQRDLGYLDVVAGCNIDGAPGATITFYGQPCTIVAKLDETGTALDNAVFTNTETIKRLITASAEQGLAVHEGKTADHVVSCVQVKVADGVNPQSVTEQVNLHVRKAWAVTAKAMTSGVASSMRGASRVIRIVVGAVWVLAAVVLAVAFAVLGRQRVREFATLRVLGASKRGLVGVVMGEAAAVSAIGALAGVALGACLVVSFAGALEQALGLPFLLPGAGTCVLIALATALVTLLAGVAASGITAARLAKVDAGNALRQE